MVFDFLFFGEDYCPICFYEKTENHICNNCKENLDFVDGKIELDRGICFYPYFYNSFIKRIIRDFKFNRKTYLVKPLAYMLAENIVRNHIEADFISYIPMYHKDEFRRGYNQSELLAREVSKMLKIPVIDLVGKIRSTKEQNKLDKESRRNNLSNSFIVKESCNLSGKSIILIDDLVTTGATFNEVSRVILEKCDVNIKYLAITSSRNGEDNDELF